VSIGERRVYRFNGVKQLRQTLQQINNQWGFIEIKGNVEMHDGKRNSLIKYRGLKDFNKLQKISATNVYGAITVEVL
jgi:hypothetical protein